MNTEQLKNGSSKKRTNLTGKERLLFVDPNSAKKGTTPPIDYIEVSELTGGGSGTADNGIEVNSGVTQLGGDLIKVTTIDTDGYDFSILNGDFTFLAGRALGSFPSMGVFRTDGKEYFVSAVLDISSISGPDVQANYGFSNGADFLGLSISGNATGLGFTSKDVRLAENISGGNSGGFVPSATSPSHYFNDVANNRAHSLTHQEDISVLSIDDKNNDRRYEISISIDKPVGYITLKVIDTVNNISLNEIELGETSLFFREINNYVDSDNYDLFESFIGSGGFYPQSYSRVGGVDTLVNQSGYFVDRIINTGLVASDYADDAAAAVGGIKVGEVYHNNGALRIRLV